jgi:hypothetical protein
VCDSLVTDSCEFPPPKKKKLKNNVHVRKPTHFFAKPFFLGEPPAPPLPGSGLGALCGSAPGIPCGEGSKEFGMLLLDGLKK